MGTSVITMSKMFTVANSTQFQSKLFEFKFHRRLSPLSCKPCWFKNIKLMMASRSRCMKFCTFPSFRQHRGDIYYLFLIQLKVRYFSPLTVNVSAVVLARLKVIIFPFWRPQCFIYNHWEFSYCLHLHPNILNTIL